MNTKDTHTYPIRNEADLISILNKVRALLKTLKFSQGARTQILTVISELGRNILLYARNGEVDVSLCNSGSRNGICLVFRDQGPGIPHIKEILEKGKAFSSTGMGLGLKGARTLADEFEVKTAPGEGSEIHFIKWENS